ncbi:MAG: hypothetical protein ABIJ39_06665 [Chloroflexota bacterium]
MTESLPMLYCANHPAVETTLCCNRCEKPICTKCVVRTPTGYRCKQCVRGQQKVFETAVWYDYLLAFGAAALGSFVASLLVTLVSTFFFGLIVLLVAPSAGIAIAELTRFVTRRHRSITMFKTAVAGMIAGGIPMMLVVAIPALMVFFGSGLGGLFALLPAVWQGVYLVLGVPAMYYRLSGIRINR